MPSETTSTPNADRVPARIDLEDPGYWQDPYPILRAARQQHAVAHTSSGQPMMLRYADVEKLEPIPTGQSPVYVAFDTEAWAFVSAFIARERAKITSDRDHELERERVEIEADRPVGYGERYPYYRSRVPYDWVRPLPRVHDDDDSGEDATPATRIPHPMFHERPPVREFTPGLGNSYRNHGRRTRKGPK